VRFGKCNARLCDQRLEIIANPRGGTARRFQCERTGGSPIREVDSRDCQGGKGDKDERRNRVQVTRRGAWHLMA